MFNTIQDIPQQLEVFSQIFSVCFNIAELYSTYTQATLGLLMNTSESSERPICVELAINQLLWRTY